MRNAIISGIAGFLAGAILGIAVLSPMFKASAPIPASKTSAARSTNFITFGTGGVTGVYYPAGGALCLLVNKGREKHGVRCSVEGTGGSISNLDAIRAGELVMGIAQSDWQFHAYNGTSRFAGQGPFRDLRAVFSIHPEPFTVVARADAGIRTMEDLEGKRVNIGNPGSGQRGTMEVLMKAKGWTTDTFAEVLELKSADQSAALCAGAIDAMVFTVGHPSASIKEATTSCDSVIVSVTGPAVDRLVAENEYYRYATVPGGMYRGNPADIPTFGVTATIVTSTRTSADTVYAVVDSVFENFDAFKMLHPAFKRLTKREMTTEGLSAPLHEGARKYFRENGLM